MAEFLNTYIFHWIPTKAIWISGHTLSWDARCAGIYIGLGLGVFCHLTSNSRAKNLPPWPILAASSLLFLPLVIDVITIKYGLREPSNDMRYLTGLFWGATSSIYLYPVFVMLVRTKTNDSSGINSLYKLGLLYGIAISALFLKTWNTLIAYIILEFLSYWGFLCLSVILALGIFKVFMNIFIEKSTNAPKETQC